MSIEKNILVIDSCVRENSRTKKIGKSFVDSYVKHNGGIIDWQHLPSMDLRPHSMDTLNERDIICKCTEAINLSKLAVHAKKFANADKIMVLAPYWDWSFPAILKTYFESVSFLNVTYCYSDSGVNGLCRASNMLYVTTSGGFIGDMNFGYDYVKGLANVFGIPKCDLIKAEGLDIVGADTDKIVSDTIRYANQLAKKW